MALELIHTSAVTGLHGRASGFCTVAMTTGMPALLEERLEALGGYRATEESTSSPPSFTHARLDVGGRRWHVLSVARAAPPDQSGRANKLVHHLLLEPSDLVDAGPAWLLRQRGVTIERFVGPPHWIPQPRPMPDSGAVLPRRASAWERTTGDAGWAGALVNQFLLDPGRVSCIVHGADVDALELVDEALALLPPAVRWQVTFGTHFQQAVAGVHCAWRFCVAGTAAANEASRRATGLMLDANESLRTHARAKQGRYVELARSGAAEWWTRDADGEPDNGETASGEGAPLRHDAPGSAWSPSATTSGTAAPMAGVARAGAGNGARDASPTSASARAGALTTSSNRDARHLGAERTGVGRTLTVIALLSLTALVAAIGAVMADRTWGSRKEGELIAHRRTVELEEERDRLRAEVMATRASIEQAQSRLADSAARERELIHERDDLRRSLSSAEARLHGYERATVDPAKPTAVPPPAPVAPSPAVAPAPSPAVAPGPSPAVAPAPSPNVPPAPSPNVPPAPTTPDDGAVPADRSAPLRGAENDNGDRFPSELLTRQVSHLGVISGERQSLMQFASPIESISVSFPSALASISTTADARSRTISLYAASSGSGATGGRRAAASVEADGSKLWFQWDASLSATRNAAVLSELDEALPFMTIAATLADGSTRLVAPAPVIREIPVGRGSPAATAIGARLPTLRLVPSALDGWSLDASRTTETLVVFVHAAGSLHMQLDRKIGRINAVFLSPLHDEFDAAQRELSALEADRVRVPPDERDFHELAIRAAREKVDALRARIARESPQLPAHFPTTAVEDPDLGRAIIVIQPMLVPSARRGGPP